MKQITLNDQTAFLLYQEPNWASPVDCSFSIISDTERGLTGKEDRTPVSRSLRASMSFDITTHRESAAEFRNALKALGNSPVLCPFWPALDNYSASDKAGIASGYWLVYEPDWAQFEIYLNGESPAIIAPSASALKVPLLWGRFDEEPQPSAKTDELSPCSIDFIDNSPAEMALTVEPQEIGSLFPLLPNWAEEVKAGRASYEIVKDEIGFGRETADVFYDQDGARIIGQAVSAHNWTEIKKLLRFFYEQAGTVGKFWLPLAVSSCRLIAISPELPGTITVSGAYDAGFNGAYSLSGLSWTKAGGYSVYKDVIWYMTNGATTYTAPDNGLPTPPANFERVLEYPQTVTVSGTGTDADATLPYSAMYEERPNYFLIIPGSLVARDLFFDDGKWRYERSGVDYSERWENPSTDFLPPKTGWSAGNKGAPSPALEYSLIDYASVSFSPIVGNQITVDNPESIESESHIALISGTKASGFEITDITDNTVTVGSLGFDYNTIIVSGAGTPSSDGIYVWDKDNDYYIDLNTGNRIDPPGAAWLLYDDLLGEYTYESTNTQPSFWDSTGWVPIGLGHLPVPTFTPKEIFTGDLDRVYSPSNTTVSPMLLSRFNEDTLDMSFITDSLAVSDITCVEVPKEYIETDSGEQGTRAYLYEFTLDGFQPWRFTSFESPIEYDGDLYEPRPFQHSEITENINMERTELELTSRRFWDVSNPAKRNPLGYFLPLRLEAILRLKIFECSPDSEGVAGSVITVFTGQVASASFDGPLITAKCSGIAALFDKAIPNILMQPTCNYALYSPPCGLLAADWKMYSTVVAYVPNSFEILITSPTFVEASPSFPRPAISIFEHFFAGGKFEKGTGTELERRSIMDSVASGENIRITLRHPFETPPAYLSTIYLWPGCDGRRETCLAYKGTLPNQNLAGKFGNFARFGGFPFVPIGNPTVAKINKDFSEGGKK